MMSLRRVSMSSSGPIVIVSSCSCGPTTCSSAALNSVASCPWVTSTIPIIMLQVQSLRERSRYFVHCEAKRKSIATKCSSQCHDRVANTTQAAQGDVRQRSPRGLQAERGTMTPQRRRWLSAFGHSAAGSRTDRRRGGRRRRPSKDAARCRRRGPRSAASRSHRRATSGRCGASTRVRSSLTRRAKRRAARRRRRSARGRGSTCRIPTRRGSGSPPRRRARSRQMVSVAHEPSAIALPGSRRPPSGWRPGRRMTKRAPSRVGSPSSSGGRAGSRPGSCRDGPR